MGCHSRLCLLPARWLPGGQYDGRANAAHLKRLEEAYRGEDELQRPAEEPAEAQEAQALQPDADMCALAAR